MRGGGQMGQWLIADVPSWMYTSNFGGNGVFALVFLRVGNQEAMTLYPEVVVFGKREALAVLLPAWSLDSLRWPLWHHEGAHEEALQGQGDSSQSATPEVG